MASPRDVSGLRLFFAADAPAEIADGRVVSTTDLIAGNVAARYGQGRVGPQLITGADGKPAWRFGGAASPASLLTADVPVVNGAPYTWVFVMTPQAGYAGQAIAPGPNSAVTSSSSQLLAESSGSFRWTAFAGASVSLPMASGEQLVVVDHDGGSGSTRLYVSTQGSARATLQRRSLAGQQHIGRHGSNDRPLHADVKAILLYDRSLTDADISTLETWRSEGASSSTRVQKAGRGTATAAVSGVGQGRARRRAPGGAAAVVSAAGTGRARRRGVGTVAVPVALAASGRAHRRGAAPVSVPLSSGASGTGGSPVAGMPEVTVEVVASGVGRRSAGGRGALAVPLASLGLGAPHRRGRGAVSVAVPTSPRGRGARAGVAPLPVSVAARGRGRAVRRGAGDLVVDVAVASRGLARRAGRGVLAVEIAMVGIGSRLRDLLVRDGDIEIELAEQRWSFSEAPARWEISEAPARWEIGVPMPYKVDRASIEWVPVDITATFADTGEPISVEGVEMCFMATGTRPGATDWRPAVVQPELTEGAGQAMLRYLGNMEPGKYDIWARVKAGDETVPRKAGTLQVL